MNDDVGPWSRMTRPTKHGHASVVSQQIYEEQLKNTVNPTEKLQ